MGIKLWVLARPIAVSHIEGGSAGVLDKDEFRMNLHSNGTRMRRREHGRPGAGGNVCGPLTFIFSDERRVTTTPPMTTAAGPPTTIVVCLWPSNLHPLRRTPLRRTQGKTAPTITAEVPPTTTVFCFAEGLTRKRNRDGSYPYFQPFLSVHS